MKGVLGRKPRRRDPAAMQESQKRQTPTTGADSDPIIRILLIEDDAPIRERLARIVVDWPEGHLVGACPTLSMALDLIAKEPIDLLVTDLKLPDGHGVDAIRTLRARHPAAEAMVISVLADDRSVIEAIEAGASGYLLKDSDPINVIDAITDVLAGRSPISSTIARTIIRRLGSHQPRPNENDRPQDETQQALTPREMDILWGIAKGFTYGELAERLNISKQTVPVHIKNIYRKLQANNRSEAVYEASRRGLIRL
jgi:DNA-binding NarL/FixJ family response regulator